MKIWTFQTTESWKKLPRDGILRSVREEDYFLDDWIAEQMSLRIGQPSAKNLEPLWGWYRCRKATGPARDVNWLTLWKEKELVRLEIEIPRAQVLLIDFDKYENLAFFHGCVPGGNWGQLYELEADLTAAGFITEILLEGIEIGRLVELEKALNTPRLEMKQIHGALAHPDLGPRVRKSWEIMFDAIYYRNGRMRHVWTEAVFWEVSLDQVVGVSHFVGKSCRKIERW